MSGPLSGRRILEIGGIGPVPFAGMVLADLGAEVIRIDRPGGIDQSSHLILLRGRRSMVLDLKKPEAQSIVRDLVRTSDALIEGFRPGVMERLGLGPDVLLAVNPKLIFGRMTGWGQTGPLAQVAGHDINYISLAGVLEPLAGGDLAPVPPHNLLGDFGGGAMFLVAGLLAGMLSADETGHGQVVDAAIIDGAASLTAMLHSLRATGSWDAPRGENLFDGGAPFYGVYETSDGRWLALGAIEPQFYAQLISGLGLEQELGLLDQNDRTAWPRARQVIGKRISERTRDAWQKIFDGTDACVTPVFSPGEAATVAHMSGRSILDTTAGFTQPAPAPRFSLTPLQLPAPAPVLGADTAAVLKELGYTEEEMDTLIQPGAIAQPTATSVRKG